MTFMSRAHSPTFPSLLLRHNSFSNPSIALPTSQLILQPFRCSTYVTVHSPTLLSLFLRHNSFSNPSIASPTSQFILQPFFCFSCITSSSLNSPGEPPMDYRTNNVLLLLFIQFFTICLMCSLYLVSKFRLVCPIQHPSQSIPSEVAPW